MKSEWCAAGKEVQLIIFAVRLAGEIKISAGGFYGSPAAQDCLRELTGREATAFSS